MKTLYSGGTILTLTGSERPQALVAEENRIIGVGSREEMEALAGKAANRVNLSGGAVLPGFIDAHSHLVSYANTLLTVPLGETREIGDVLSALRTYAEGRVLAKSDWIIGFGYDHNQLREGRHPTRRELDAAGIPNPVLITHRSGHMGVLNSRGLEQAGCTAGTPDPEGGKIGREGSGKEPNGYLEEAAFFQASGHVPRPTREQMLRAIEQAQSAYFSYGITTAQEGLAKEAECALLSAMGQKLKLDVVGYIDLKESAGLWNRYSNYQRRYQNHFKLGGYKIFLDGSPQGRTAWMREPYLGGGPEDRGYPRYGDGEVEELLETAYRNQVQILAHCNGDAACAQYIRCLRKVQARWPGRNLRPVMIHAQLVGTDQLEDVKELGLIPSYFAAHVYYWGDTHLKNFGRERAFAISPLRATAERGMRFTLHQDSPVIQPDMLETVWCAVNRRSKGGVILGEQSISVEEALRGVTIYGAYQYFEEARKGTLQVGKQADLVLLDRNPLGTDPMDLKKIQVLRTVKAGETVYDSGDLS